MQKLTRDDLLSLEQYAEERRDMLCRLVGIENCVFVHVADEDLACTDGEKTSAVHFLRFELPSEQVVALKSGASLIAGIDHDNYSVEVSPVADDIRTSLLNDLI